MLIVACFSVFNDFFSKKKIIAENENLLLHYSKCLLCFQHLKSSYKCHELGRSNFHNIPTHMRGEGREGRKGGEGREGRRDEGGRERSRCIFICTFHE